MQSDWNMSQSKVGALITRLENIFLILIPAAPPAVSRAYIAFPRA